MDKKTLRDVDLKGKRVVMRVDFNVPIKEGVIKDDTRIKGALPSIQYVLDHGGSLVLMSHLGRPAEKGYEADFSLKPVAEYLAKMLGRPVAFAPDCANADKEVAAMKPGDVLMLAGVGEVFPFMRIHTLLEALQPYFSDVPILVMYPGEFDGRHVKLFNRLTPNDYYRAFNVIE